MFLFRNSTFILLKKELCSLDLIYHNHIYNEKSELKDYF